jgi:hypothetical protein
MELAFARLEFENQISGAVAVNSNRGYRQVMSSSQRQQHHTTVATCGHFGVLPGTYHTGRWGSDDVQE